MAQRMVRGRGRWARRGGERVVAIGDALVREPAERAVQGPTALEFFFLQRLATLIARQDAAREDEQRVALAQAAFSTYLDCLALGLADEAEALMERDPHTLLLWRLGQTV